MFLISVLWLRGMDHKQELLCPPPRSKSHGKQASPLQAGARSTRRGLRVEVVYSLGRSFVGQMVFDLFSYPTHLFKVIGDVDFLDAMEVVE
jgi:hypothetical protein